MNIKLIGRDSGCDWVIDQPDVGPVQARLELTADGHVYLLDADSASNSYLNRNDQWIKIHKVRLCVADRIRFGDFEVPLQQLIAVFGKQVNIRLGDERYPRQSYKQVISKNRDNNANSVGLHKPRRNPLTGKIEKDPIPFSQTDENNLQPEQAKDG